MPRKMKKTVLDMVAEANKQVREIPLAEAIGMHGRDDIAFIDLRDIREVGRTGTIAGAHHVPRGMLEFWIDPESPYYKPFFEEEKTFVFYCAGAWRSALAAKTADDMGLEPVAHLEGGINAWIEAGGPIDPPKEKK